MKFIKRAKAAYICVSALLAAVGLVLIIFPEISALIMCWLLGAVSVAVGIVKIIGYFSSDPYRLAFQFDFAFGITAIILGVLIIIHPAKLTALIPIIMGIYIMTDGIMKIQTSVDAKRFGIKSWWLILLSAVITGAAGVLLLINPFESAAALTVLLGILLLLDGVQNICVAAYTVKAIRREELSQYIIYTDNSKEDN